MRKLFVVTMAVLGILVSTALAMAGGPGGCHKSCFDVTAPVVSIDQPHG